MNRSSASWVFGIVVVLAFTSSLSAKQVQLDVSMSKATLLANKKQNTSLRVALTGFKFAATEQRTPVNIAIVLDKSGSMSGEKIARAKEAAIGAINRLNKNDIISVVTYDSTVKVLVPATKLTDKRAVCRMINGISAGGSTALFAGVSKGAEELRKFIDKDRVSRVILLSDGLANVGPQSPSELGSLGASLKKERISVTTLGLGLDYNEDLMTQLAQKSSGNHMFIERATDLAKIFQAEFDDVLSVVAQEVAVKITVADGIRPIKVLGVDAEVNGQEVIVQINQLYSEQEKYVVVEIEMPATKSGKSRKVADVQVSYANMQTKTTDRLASTVSVNFSDSAAQVEKSINKDAMISYILLCANDCNEFACTLRDKGDIKGAQALLLQNADYLNDNAKYLNSDLLKKRYADNYYQANNLNETDWARVRKLMRRLQHLDKTNQSY